MKNTVRITTTETLCQLQHGHSDFALEACGRRLASDPKHETAKEEQVVNYSMADFPYLPSEEQLKEALELMDDLSSGDLLDMELGCGSGAVALDAKTDCEQGSLADPALETDNIWSDEELLDANLTRRVKNFAGFSGICDDYDTKSNIGHPLARLHMRGQDQLMQGDALSGGQGQSEDKEESSDSASGDARSGSQESKGRCTSKRTTERTKRRSGNCGTADPRRSDELRRLRRVLSNRESARRSRKRRADQIVTLESRLSEAYEKINSLQANLESAKARLFVVEAEKSHLQSQLLSLNGGGGHQIGTGAGTSLVEEQISQIPSTPCMPRSSNVVHFKSPIRQLQTNRQISFRLRPKAQA